MKNSILKYCIYLLVVTLWATMAFILPDFMDSPIAGWRDILTLCAYLCVLAIASLWVVLLGTINQYVAMVFLPVFSVIGSVVAYFRAACHATITPIVLEVTFQTNMAEASSVMTWQLWAYTALNLCIAIMLVWWRQKTGKIHYEWMFALAALVALPVYYHCNSRIHQAINQRYPYNLPYNLYEYLHLRQSKQQVREMPPATVVEPTDTDLTIIVILGEAIRADHLSLNGYARNTTPKLNHRSNLINLGDVYSMHTHTSASVPHLLTPADSLHPDLAYSKESWIPYLHNIGFRTSWISNQDITDSYAHFIYSADTIIFPNSEKSVYVYDHWSDDDLIQPLLDCLNDTAKNMCILHTIGAHWYYNNHVSPRSVCFTPTTTNRIITHNDSMAVVNSYDNSILTMDGFVDSLCTLLTDKNAIIIYQSDHGESLGEEGNWLHAAGAEETKHTAGFIWYSEQYREHHPDMISHIDSLSHEHLCTDYLFPLVMRIAGLKITE